ncbi:MAG: hypothetical protein OEX12_09565 [Gammaproteobacteria bacterium]|nr:hypothetical protein [Gammaproteobacteria bacterium]
MQTLTKTAPKAVRVSATLTLVASWAVVLVMVGFVLFKWSPVRVFDGELGVLSHTAKIYPLDDNLYMKVEGTQAPNREKWNFVLVDRERALDESDFADFTYYWGSKEHEYTDYSIPLKIILAGKVKNFRFTRREAEASYIWTDGDWKVASTEAVEKPFAFNWHWHANADKGLQELAEKLASSNRVVRAKARKELHSLSESGLKQLEGMSDDQGLVHQIELEKERRER